jgi:hypothetical protein
MEDFLATENTENKENKISLRSLSPLWLNRFLNSPAESVFVAYIFLVQLTLAYSLHYYWRFKIVS